MSDLNTTVDAFLLTRQWRDTAKGIVLDFWFCSDSGPIHVMVENQQAIFFIQQKATQSVSKLLHSLNDFCIKPLKLKDFNYEPVAGVYFTSQQSVYQARELLSQHQIQHYEADIRPVERYLTERFLSGPVTIDSPEIQSKKNKETSRLILNPKIKSGHYKPNPKIISLDIETAYDSQELYAISLLSDNWHVTLMKGEINTPNHHSIECFISEKSLMLRFIELILQQDPDIIIGWNVINFDFRFLQRKADSLKISLAIGRAESLPIWRKAQTEQAHYFLLIPGRVVLDGIETLKSATWNFRSFSLEFIGHALLGRGKLIKSENTKEKNNHDPLQKAKEIKRQFYEDKPSLAAYNLEDCQLVLDIFKKTHLIEFAIERARLTGLEMDRSGGSVAAFDNQYLPQLHRKGFVAPDIHTQQENISAPGGYVMNSKPGLYDSVLVLDYKSLYPSIIRTFQVDPYARIKAEKMNPDECIPGFNGVYFSRTDAILPDIIKSLWQARDTAKRHNNQTLSQAIKIIMNSFYGVLGTSGCRLHDSRLTSSITLRGHELMKQTAVMIEEEGYNVIYGDTDSVFVSLNGKKSNESADKVGKDLTAKINDHWKKVLKEQYQITSFLEMEYETHYERFFMPTIRGSDKGSKKRYAGMLANNEKKIIYKGLETVRTDWTELAREVQQEVYQRIFNDLPYENYLKNIVINLKQGKLDNQLVYQKRLRQKLSDYKKNVPPHAQAAMKAENYLKNSINQTIQKNRYEFGGTIEYVITLKGAEPIEFNQHPLDYEHYIEKQIAPAVDALLTAMGTSLEKIIQAQFELF